MSTMANTTPIVTTVTKTANNEKTPKDADAALKAKILDFCEEHYEDIMPVIMDKIRRDKRKEVHARLDFGENPKKSRRVREGSQNSSAGTLPARYHDPLERPKIRDHLKYNDEDVFDRLGHRRHSAFDRLSNTYSPSTTKSGLNEGNSRDSSHSRGRSRRRGFSSRDRPRDRNRPCGIEESYRRESESPLSRVSESDTSDGGHWKTRAKRRKPADEEDLSVPWTSEDVDPSEKPLENIPSCGTGRTLSNTYMVPHVQLYLNRGRKGLQKKYVKDPLEIHNIKQMDRETIEEFMKRFKIETGCMKGAPECMRISGFMYGVDNPELTKRLNEHFLKTGGNDDCHHGFYTGRNRYSFQKERKVKPPPPMVNLVEKINSNKFCEFHNDKGHSTDEYVQLRKQIVELQRVTRQKVTQSFAHVKEITFPPLTANKGTGGPLFIEAKIGGHAVHRIYVNRGFSMEVLYEQCFNRLQPEIKSQMVPVTTSLTGFSGGPLGQLKLLVTIGDAEHYTKSWMNFMIVRSPSLYNGIIGRHGIREIQAVPSMAHGMLKFPVNGGIVTIRSTIHTPTECATIAATPKDPAKKAEARYENFKVAIHPDFPDQEITSGGAVSTKARTELCTLLKGNLDIFAWKPSDMTRVPRSIFEHRIDIREGYSPVESLCGYPFKCFLDAYKGYHQIQMAEQDEKKTAFHTSHGLYYYTKMPFGLKNTGATYHRLVDKAFDRQIGRNLEIYVDDLVIKSHTKTELLRDIEETIRTLRKINMKLNPKKSVHQKSDFHWTPEAEQAFKQLKQHLAKLPMLVAPKPKEELIMYLSASYAAISAVLMTERNTVQTPVYFMSRVLQAPELNYTPMEKLVPTLICAAKRLHGYFQVLVEVLKENPIQEREMATVVEDEGPTWMTSIIEYLRDETLLDNRKEASKLRIKVRQYELLEGILYRCSFLNPWLRCARPHQADYVIREIHEGSCKGPGNVKFLIVAIDYFTKWIEAKAVATISDSQVKKFVWVNIVCRFGLPEEIVTDNGKQFSGDPFKDWHGKLNIVQRFALVKHPQSNGLIERENGSLAEGINARLCEGNKNWLKELLHVLWAHRTMIKSSNNDTLFSLTYGTKAVIPAEIGMPTYRTAVVDIVNNDEELRLNLDLLEERRERAAIREAKAKLKMIKYYNARVKCVTFRPGDFFYRSNDASHAVDGGKLDPKWEGPYEVTKALGDGAYKLRSADRTVLPRT
nr:reverse transcriptase domain-containing protein [Tanacetum cinerariifolium]